MEKRRNASLWLGLGLIFFGAILLIQEFGYFYFPDELVVASAFALGALLLGASYLHTKEFWKLVVAIGFLFVASTITISTTHILPDQIIGTISLWLGAAVFGVVYFSDRRHTWSIIPAGLLLTLGFVVLSDAYGFFRGDSVGAVLFLGFGLTFLLLYVLRGPQQRLAWSLWTAACFLVLAGFLWLQETIRFDAGDFVVPLLLILFGGYLISKNIRRSRNGQANHAQA